MHYALRDYQESAVMAAYNFVRFDEGHGYVTMPGGCHEINHPILLKSGVIKPVQEVSIGDVLIGDDGGERKVIRIHRGNEEMYRITPIKGEPFIVNAGHMLALKLTGASMFNPEYRRKNEYISISVSDYLKTSNNFKRSYVLYRSKTVDFSHVDEECIIDPWVLGVLIGDGSFTQCTTSVCTPDEEIMHKLNVWAEKNNFSLCKYKKKNSKAYQIYISGRLETNRRKSRINNQLTQLGLRGLRSGEKFIPDSYKLASVDVRREVLAGILDTDGHLHHNGYDYISKSERLADDVCFVARSLGLAAYKKQCEKYCQTGAGGVYWHVSISGDVDIIPCCVDRKKSKARRQKKSALVTGFSVESVGKGDFYGFEVDGNHLYLDGRFTVHHNSGKSVVIAKLAERLLEMGVSSVILARSEKLVTQNMQKISPHHRDSVGVYCASIGKRETDKPITVGTIQSLAGVILDCAPAIALVDECSEINPDEDGDTQYWRFFRDNGNPRIIGFDATPYRTASGLIKWGKEIINVPIAPLVKRGFLVPPVTRICASPDLSEVPIEMGEYSQSALASVYDDPELLRVSVENILKYGEHRRSGLIFTQGLRHADLLADMLERNGQSVCTVSGDTCKEQLNEEIFPAFEAGELKYLINCQLLTVGIDLPCVDFIALLMATKSKRKFSQILYRGTRPYAGKKDFLVLDMGNNFYEHGELGSPYRDRAKREQQKQKGKACPQCELWIAQANAKVCLECGFEFVIEAEPAKVKHEYEPYGTDNTVYAPIRTYRVDSVSYGQKKSKKGDDMIVISYCCHDAKYGKITEYLLPHHAKTFLVQKAKKFFADRDHALIGQVEDYSIEDLIYKAKHFLKTPYEITVDHSKEFPEIIRYTWVPPTKNVSALIEDEIPF